MATLGLVPPLRTPLLPGQDEDPDAMPEAAPPAPLTAVTPGQGAGGGDSGTAAVLAAALTPPTTVDTTVTKGAQTNRTTTETTPEIEKGLAAHGDATAREAAADAKIADENTRLATEAADAADKKAALAQELAARRAQKAAEDQKLVDAAVTEEKQRRQQMDAVSTMHSFWGEDNRGAPARIFASVMSALADYAHLKAGGQGPSVASEYIEGEIAKDRQRKLDAFTRAKDFQQLASKDVDHARDVLADHLKQLDAESEVQRNKLTAMLEAQLSRSKIPLAAAEAQKLRAASDAKNQESDVQLREKFAAKVAREGSRRDTTHTDNDKANKGKDSKPTADESTRAERGAGIEEAVSNLQKMDPTVITSAASAMKANENRMAASDKTSQSGILQSLGVEGALRGTTLAPSSKLHGMSDPQKIAAANIDKWNSFVLHELTGAAYSAGEKSDVTSGFTVTPDDSPASVRKKLDDGMAYAKRLNLLSGPAAQARLNPPTAAAKPAEEAKPAKAPSRFADAHDLAMWLQRNPKADPEKRAQVRETLRKLRAGEGD
jgi:hypothetical protein